MAVCQKPIVTAEGPLHKAQAIRGHKISKTTKWHKGGVHKTGLDLCRSCALPCAASYASGGSLLQLSGPRRHNETQ